jgi:hypothetical protein
MITTIEFKNCRDCPFKTSSRGQGECWEACAHPDNSRPYYDSILWGCQEHFESIPDWCPIKKQSME